MTAAGRNSCLGLIVGVLMLVGCRGTQCEAARQTQSSHLRSLITLYNYSASKLGDRPANEAELKAFIAANASQMIESLHIDKVDELFVSERDGKPFVVFYGEAPKGPARDVIAYEQTGVAGNRLVGYSLGMTPEVDEAQFAQIMPVGKP